MNILNRKIIYRWKNPSLRKYRIMNNEAAEYIIVRENEASSGIVIYGKFNDEWSANPWSTRPLIKQLCNEIKELKKMKDIT